MITAMFLHTPEGPETHMLHSSTNVLHFPQIMWVSFQFGGEKFRTCSNGLAVQMILVYLET